MTIQSWNANSPKLNIVIIQDYDHDLLENQPVLILIWKLKSGTHGVKSTNFS